MSNCNTEGIEHAYDAHLSSSNRSADTVCQPLVYFNLVYFSSSMKKNYYETTYIER